MGALHTRCIHTGCTPHWVHCILGALHTGCIHTGCMHTGCTPHWVHCTLGAFTLGALHTRSIAHRVHAHWVYSTLDASHTECSIHWAHCTQGTLPATCATHAHSTRQGHCTLHALCTGPVSHSGSGGQSTAVARRRRGARRDLGFQGVLASSRETNKHTTTRYRVC